MTASRVLEPADGCVKWTGGIGPLCSLDALQIEISNVSPKLPSVSGAILPMSFPPSPRADSIAGIETAKLGLQCGRRVVPDV